MNNPSRKSMIRVFIVIALFSITVTVTYWLGGLDRLNLRQNQLEIRCNKALAYSDDNLRVFLCQGNDSIMYSTRIRLATAMPDWYGDDKLIITYKNQSAVARFKNFKYKSWQKVSAAINLIPKGDSIQVQWKLKTIGYENVGEEMFKK